MFDTCSFSKRCWSNNANCDHILLNYFYSGIGVQNMLKWGTLVAIGFIIVATFMFMLDMVPSYLQARFSTLTNPFSQESGTGYHISNSLLVGGLFGRGLGNSIMKLGYLPEPHRLHICYYCEEMGLIGLIVLILEYFVYIVLSNL